MIDIENAKRVFKEYVKDYNPNDGKIALKISHILRVTQKSRELAEELNTLFAFSISIISITPRLLYMNPFHKSTIYIYNKKTY